MTGSVPCTANPCSSGSVFAFSQDMYVPQGLAWGDCRVEDLGAAMKLASSDPAEARRRGKLAKVRVPVRRVPRSTTTCDASAISLSHARGNNAKHCKRRVRIWSRITCIDIHGAAVQAHALANLTWEDAYHTVSKRLHALLDVKPAADE